jgi:hypothetical protein
MRLGGASLSAPPAPALPRFPVMLVDDVPVMLIGGYMLGGMAEPVTAHLEYYRKNGKLRTAPLAPKRGTDRAAEFEKAYQAAYGAPPAADVRELVLAQLARVKL